MALASPYYQRMVNDISCPQQSSVLLILGMHRSGTSAVARAVESFGLSLGDRLLGSAPDNPKGYWEDADGVALNQRILEQCALRWNEARILSAKQLLTTAGDSLCASATDLLANRVACWGSWAFKDPRTLRTLPIWLHAAGQAQVEIRSLLVLRHPLEICASLATRNQMDSLRAQLMWAAHWLPFLPLLRGGSMAVVQYDEVLSAPVRVLSRVAEQLGYTVNQESLQQYGKCFLDRNLRHHQAESGEKRLLPLVADTYALLRELDALPAEAFWLAWKDLQVRHREWSDLYALLDAETEWRRRRRGAWWRWSHGQFQHSRA